MSENVMGRWERTGAKRDLVRRLAAWIGLLLLGFPTVGDGAVKRDEEVVLLPGAAWPAPGGAGWDCEVVGYVFEPESRRLTLAAMESALGLGGVELTATERALFRERARMFLVDQEGGKQVTVRLEGTEARLRPTGGGGAVRGRMRIRDGGVIRPGTKAEVAVRLERGDARSMTAGVFFVGAAGVSVVSDIDDTIKVSEVRDRSALLRNTFVRPHQAVTGMPGLYRDWVQRPGVAVHYLSAGPWPLAPTILGFLRSEGFPGGALYLRDFSWSREGVAGLLAPTREHKGRVLEELLARWPERTLVLVGDSGEQDPEIYADIARRHVGRVVGIAIRDVTGEDAGAERYRSLREGIPGVEWVVFREARDLEAAARAWFE